MKAVYIKILNINTWYIDCFPFMYWFCFPPCIFYHLLFFYDTFSDWCCIVAMKKGVFIFLFKHICCHCIVAAIEIVFFFSVPLPNILGKVSIDGAFQVHLLLPCLVSGQCAVLNIGTVEQYTEYFSVSWGATLKDNSYKKEKSLNVFNTLKDGLVRSRGCAEGDCESSWSGAGAQLSEVVACCCCNLY